MEHSQRRPGRQLRKSVLSVASGSDLGWINIAKKGAAHAVRPKSREETPKRAQQGDVNRHAALHKLE
jgi:predicted nicotinamide N-methyase